MGMWTLASARQNSMCKEIEPSDEMMIVKAYIILKACSISSQNMNSNLACANKNT